MGTAQNRRVHRRWLLTTTGRGVVGFALLGVAACSGDETTTSSSAEDEESPSDPGTPDPSPTTGDAALAWERVDLGFVSAYVLVRGREAAVVDTGVGGSASAIGDVLADAGPGWDGVRHVVLTHKHPDHVGSVGEVLAEAPEAVGYVGEADLPEVDSPRPLSALAGGDEVFGLQVVATPGHTAGHLSVFDPDTGVLVAGDALTNDGRLTGSNPQFTEDDAQATASIQTMAALVPETILVGHGAPVLDNAAQQLQELADSLR